MVWFGRNYTLCTCTGLHVFLVTVILWRTISATSINQTVDKFETMKRSRRGSDEWVRDVRENFCPWAECEGLFGCNPGNMCAGAPTKFGEERRDPPVGQTRRCFAVKSKDCAEAPKEDECACITSGGILQIGYGVNGEGAEGPANTPISNFCSSMFNADACSTTTDPTSTALPPQTTPVTTEANPPSQTTAEEVTTRASYSTTDVGTEGRTTTLTPTMTVTTGTAAQATNSPDKGPLTDGGNGDGAEGHVTASPGPMTASPGPMTASAGPMSDGEGAPLYIAYWLPALIGLALVVLLMALFRRRQRLRRTSAELKLKSHTKSVCICSPCSESGPLKVNPNVEAASGEAATHLNPSYERNISGTELERSGDFFCPPLSETPNQLRAKDRMHSPGHPREVHGNPPALLGNFNAAFSEGNYSEHLPAAEAGYDNPGRFISPGGDLTEPLQHPRKNPKSPAGHGYEEPPYEDQRSPLEGGRDPVPYEITSISPRGSRSTPLNPDTSYEVASINPTGLRQTLPKYAKVNKSNGVLSPGSGGNSPGADSGYEVASISPGHSPAPTGSPLRYDYAYASPAGYPPGKHAPAHVNQYNVIESQCKEGDGEYSMLNRNKGEGYQTSPTVPIIMSANEYNTIDILSKN